MCAIIIIIINIIAVDCVALCSQCTLSFVLHAVSISLCAVLLLFLVLIYVLVASALTQLGQHVY